MYSRRSSHRTILLSSAVRLQQRYLKQVQGRTPLSSSPWQNRRPLPPRHSSPIRCFSDRLLGHSPMGPAAIPNIQSTANIPTAADVTTSGGVWAPTSKKREILTDLKMVLAELNLTSLDDLATNDQKLDLYLSDGILAIVSIADQSHGTSSTDHEPALEAVVVHLTESPAADLTQSQWEDYLAAVAKGIEEQLATIPAGRCLRDIRDFYLLPDSESEQGTASNTATTTAVRSHAREAVVRLRLFLALGACNHLKASWKTLTAVSDQDVDRAATQGKAAQPAVTLSTRRAQDVILAFMKGGCPERVQAMWNLMDRDGDGLLDESEMNATAYLSIEPVRLALDRLFSEALEAYSVRAPLPPITEDGKPWIVPTPGWRQRRRETKIRKALAKTFKRVLKVHFVDEVEMPHRLRCIYAWANKAHQDNKIDSVLVDDVGWTGRKRYVELNPKISLPEFREVQQEHFTHLDRVGHEFIKSFREELWISQGKGRNRQKLMRDGSLFLAGVCTVDFIIGTL